MSKTVTNYAQFHVNTTARVAKEAHAALMKDPCTRLYLYYRPMELAVFAEPPDSTWALGENEHVPSDRTVEQLCSWFAARTGKLPYLTEG